MTGIEHTEITQYQDPTPNSPLADFVADKHSSSLDCPCLLCDDPNCNGLENVLRKYKSWPDLSSHCGEEFIVECVNRLYHLLIKKREVTRRVATRRREVEKSLRQFAKDVGLEVE